MMELKHKTDILVSDLRKLRIIQVRQIFPRKSHKPGSGLIEGTDYVEKRAFSGP